MKDARAILLDFNPSDNLCNKLREILGSSPNIGIYTLKESVKVSAPLFCDKLSGAISSFNPHLLFVFLAQANLEDPAALLQRIRREVRALPVVVVTEDAAPDKIVELLKLGIDDFITAPIKAIDIFPRIWRLLEQRQRDEALIQKIKENIGMKELVGESQVFLEEIKKIPLISKCDANVLITGETGTGKELCARAIHYLSGRAGKPFIPVNCGAIPPELVENELFGHVQGAFTSALKSSPGLINEADGGSLFLDEIDCLPFHAQVKFLRFIQDKEYRQLGCIKMRQADVRIIAASNINLEDAVSEQKFRRDLFYRLNIIPLILPPLRERKEDIPLLSRHFLIKYAEGFNKRMTEFDEEALQKLIMYEWPGNVRELENVIERAVIFSTQKNISGSDILLRQIEQDKTHESFRSAKARVIEQFEKNYIHGVLLANQGNITKAARVANKNRRALWELIRKYKIDTQRYNSSSLHKTG